MNYTTGKSGLVTARPVESVAKLAKRYGGDISHKKKLLE